MRKPEEKAKCHHTNVKQFSVFRRMCDDMETRLLGYC